MIKPLKAIAVIALISSCTYDNREDQLVNNPPCEPANVSFMKDVKPIINNNCLSCHNSSEKSGGVSLSDYAGVRVEAGNGKLVGVITHTSGYPAMPQGGKKLPDCDIKKIQAWVNEGALDN